MEDIDKLKKKLGRIVVEDARDKAFPMSAVLPKSAPERHYKYYGSGWKGDQRLTPQCVAYAWLHWLEDGGIVQDHKAPPVLNPSWLYQQCQRNDHWEGENYDGTSVRAGAKILQREGYISEYRWTWNIDELITAVLSVAPVVVGTVWYEDMFFPDKDGLIKVGGRPMGGHAYLISGCNTEREILRIKNSWGEGYGRNGYVDISFSDMERLIQNGGEVCLASEIKK